jgi:anti-anti-sigma factor
MIEITIDKNIIIATVIGGLDVGTSDALKKILAEKMANATHSILDISQVDYLNSYGINALITFKRDYENVCLVNAQNNLLISKIVDLIGLENFMDIFFSVEEALEKWDVLRECGTN